MYPCFGQIHSIPRYIVLSADSRVIQSGSGLGLAVHAGTGRMAKCSDTTWLGALFGFRLCLLLVIHRALLLPYRRAHSIAQRPGDYVCLCPLSTPSTSIPQSVLIVFLIQARRGAIFQLGETAKVGCGRRQQRHCEEQRQGRAWCSFAFGGGEQREGWLLRSSYREWQ